MLDEREIRSIDGPALTVHRLRTPIADVWVASEDDPLSAYHYGGSRLVPPDVTDRQAEALLADLTRYESALKNRLINGAFAQGALSGLEDAYLPGFVDSVVGGGRCLIRPRSELTHAVLGDPGHRDFASTADGVLAEVGTLLNDLDGTVKLTPDFGRYAGLADLLHRHTSQVLGVGSDKGGCGGAG